MYHLDHTSKFLCSMAGLDAADHCIVLIGPNSLPSFESKLPSYWIWTEIWI